MKIINKVVTVILVVGTCILSGCAVTTKNPFETEYSNATVGATACGGAGALIGSLVGGDIVGGLVGGTVGAIICGVGGNYLDNQEAELRQRLQQVGIYVLNEGKKVRFILPGSKLCGRTDLSRVAQSFYPAMDELVRVLKQFPDRGIIVQGHVFDTGDNEKNADLSQQLADNVAELLYYRGVSSDRILTTGFGAKKPIVANDTETGQILNRRVEIVLLPF
ncbi:MAG: OmpA family protein [Gammaproteobacteria bacterium]